MGGDKPISPVESPQRGEILVESLDSSTIQGFSGSWREVRSEERQAPARLKYPTNENIERLTYEYANAPDKRTQDRVYGGLVNAYMDVYRPWINKLVRKYSSFDPACGPEDQMQNAYVAIISGLQKYRNSRNVTMKFSTYLYWEVCKACADGANGKDSYVEITRPDGRLFKRVPYNEWQAVKRSLEPQGYIGTSVRPYQLSALFENEGGPDENISTSMTDLDEPLIASESPEAPEDMEAKESEPLEEPTHDIHREIDSLYRKSRHIDLRSIQGQGVLAKVYGIYRYQLLALAAQHGHDWSASEPVVQTAAEKEIANSWHTYSDDLVPGARYSLYLEAIMRRRLPSLLRQE